jgi:hypothetical protein
MKSLTTISRSINKQLLKYFVAQSHSFETANFEQKEFILMQAHSRIYNLIVYFFTSVTIMSLTMLIRWMIITGY